MSGPAISSRTPVDLDDFEARLRRSQPNADPYADPLAELARLVEGQRLPAMKPQPPQVRHDPYDSRGAMHTDDASARGQYSRDADGWALRGAAGEDHHDARGAYGAADGNVGRDRAPAPLAQPAYDHDHFGQPAYAQPDHSPSAPLSPPGAWRQEDAVWEETPAPRRRSRAGLYALSGALCILLVGGAGAYFLRGGQSAPAVAPTIKAASGPLKVAPEAPAQASGPSSTASVLDKAGEKIGASRVVASEEQPVDLSQVRSAAAGAPSTPARPASAFPEPIKVKTVSVRPDGTIISASDAPAKPAAVVGTPPLLAQAPPQRTASNITGTTPPVASPPSPPAAKPAAAAPAPAPAPVAAPAKTTARISPPSDTPAPKPAQAAAAAPAVASGGFAVQLAAAGSEAEARDKIGKYQRQFASALDGHAPGVVKGEANGKSVWRIRVGGLSREGAVSMCVGIKDTGGSCFVAAN